MTRPIVVVDSVNVPGRCHSPRLQSYRSRSRATLTASLPVELQVISPRDREHQQEPWRIALRHRHWIGAIFLGLVSSCLLVSFGIHKTILFHEQQSGDGDLIHYLLTGGSASGSGLGLMQRGESVGPYLSLRRGRRLLGSDPPKRQPRSQTTDAHEENDNEIEEEDEESGLIEIVHIVYTRFMQFQPDLVELGRARLETFRTFCLPSMVHQTSSNYLWIIHADPGLNPEIKGALIDMVSPYSNFLLVGSNSFPSNFRKTAVADLLSDPSKQLWSGDIRLARMGYEASLKWPVLETRLDADDGLHNYFVELVQKEAVLSLGEKCGAINEESGYQVDQEQFIPVQERQQISPLVEQGQWKMYCAFTSMEWQPLNPFPHDHLPLQDSNRLYGYVVGVATPYCQTPGLTIGYCPDMSFTDIPNVPHHKLLQTVPECPDDEKLPTKCVKRLKMLSPASIRARTITSHGMMNVMVSEGETREVYRYVANQMEKQDVLWSGIEEYMHITKEDSARAKDYIKSHQAAIAADNLKGQCTKGHSCKHSTQEVLQNLAQK